MPENSRDTALVISPLLADEPEWDEARLQVLVKAIGRRLEGVVRPLQGVRVHQSGLGHVR